MNLGYAAIFQNPGRELPDREVVRRELDLAALAAPLGFRSVWSTEHHFTGYEVCPDVVQFLSYMAGRCPTLELGTMVIVLPWHDPLRVAETISALDHYCGGRLSIGFGRGASPSEHEGYRVPLAETRPRFMEYAAAILEGLETGTFGYSGTYLKQPPVPLRPAPSGTFRGRAYGAAVSPASLKVVADLGLGLLLTPQKPWPEVAADLARFRQLFQSAHGTAPIPPVTLSFVFCDEDRQRAHEQAQLWCRQHARSALRHYELGRGRYGADRGYDFYHQVSSSIAREGAQDFIEGFMELAVWGTPEECYERARHIWEHTRCSTLVTVFRFGAMPYETAERSMRLFSSEVLPALSQLD